MKIGVIFSPCIRCLLACPKCPAMPKMPRDRRNLMAAEACRILREWFPVLNIPDPDELEDEEP